LESLSLSVTLPPAGTVKARFANVTFCFSPLNSSLFTLTNAAFPVRPALPLKRNLNRRFGPTVIGNFWSAKLAFAGGFGVSATIPLMRPILFAICSVNQRVLFGPGVM
jgi:hypothetical protein